MRRYLLLFSFTASFLFLLTRCASQATHEYCVTHSDQYGGYDRCQAACDVDNTGCTDNPAGRALRGLGKSLRAGSETMQQSMPQQDRYNCRPDGFGGYDCRR